MRDRAREVGIAAVLVMGEGLEDNRRVEEVVRNTFSIPPSVVRSEQKQKLARKLPLDALLLESDSPVLGPVKDARNEPVNVIHARDFIAEAHGVLPEKVDQVTTENALRLFPALKRVVWGFRVAHDRG